MQLWPNACLRWTEQQATAQLATSDWTSTPCSAPDPHARPGRVRLSVISTRFLDAAKLEFWVSQLLVAVRGGARKSPQPRLQAVFLFDEADIYLPAGTKQPATKAPMEDLLKRARSAGVGIFLATQSPGDFDYKCKENVRTWLIGRVKETQAIDKLKPMLAAGKGDVASKLAGQGRASFILSANRCDGGAVGRVVPAHRTDAGEPDREARPRIAVKRFTRAPDTAQEALRLAGIETDPTVGSESLRLPGNSAECPRSYSGM